MLGRSRVSIVVVRTTAVACVASSFGCTGSGTVRHRYSNARCVPPLISGQRPAREWRSTEHVPNGGAVLVSGIQAPGGRIAVRYLSDQKEETAAAAADDVSPADVRIDALAGRLYVKTSAGGASARTTLFEYDLRQRKQTAQEDVDGKGLPAECSP
jgi:hypothetical protein